MTCDEERVVSPLMIKSCMLAAMLAMVNLLLLAAAASKCTDCREVLIKNANLQSVYSIRLFKLHSCLPSSVTSFVLNKLIY